MSALRSIKSGASDVQARRPRTHVSLARVGVTGVQKMIRIRPGADGEQLFYAELDCFVDLGPRQKGAHMSRFEETVEEAIDEVVLGEAFKAETLASHIAERVRERQAGLRAEVTISARYPEHKRTPVSDLRTQAIYTLFGCAVASPRGTRRLVGVEAQGMTACPCAQELLITRARERLAVDGFDDAEIERILESVPIATHNQRGLGTLYVGCPEGCTEPIEAQTLLRIVEASMSSDVYELMKRADEAEVVERAHRHPRFVEDCVREAIRMAVDEFRHLDDHAFVLSRQENLETIHHHNVVAERYGLLGELRGELSAGGATNEAAHLEPAGDGRHLTMSEWLDGDRAPR